MAAMFVAAMREWQRSQDRPAGSFMGLQMRIEKVMDVTVSREIERLERRLMFLASVGSTAPFVGLFGTVWGIMTSFQAIAASDNTSLAGRRAGYRRGAVRHRPGPSGGHPRDRRLQPVFLRGFQPGGAPGGLRGRVFGHTFAAIG